MTRRVFVLRNELLKFYEQRNHIKNDLVSTEFLSRLAYLLDSFDTLNHVKMFFQGPINTISDVVSKSQVY